MFECWGGGVHSQVLVSVAHIWKREEFLPPEPNPPCAVQPMCNDGSSSWKCRNKNWNSCRWTYERCWESGIQFNPLPIIPVSQKHFPTFNAGELAKGNLLHLKSHGLCTQPRKWEGVLVLVVVPQIGRPHHVLAPTHCWGQRNATNKEKNMHHLLPAACTRTPPNIYPANDDDNYSDGGDGDSGDKMHWFNRANEQCKQTKVE